MEDEIFRQKWKELNDSFRDGGDYSPVMDSFYKLLEKDLKKMTSSLIKNEGFTRIYDTDDCIQQSFLKLIERLTKSDLNCTTISDLKNYLYTTICNFFFREGKKQSKQKLESGQYEKLNNTIDIIDAPTLNIDYKIIEDLCLSKNPKCYTLLEYIIIRGFDYKKLIEFPEYSGKSEVALRQRKKRCLEEFKVCIIENDLF